MIVVRWCVIVCSQGKRKDVCLQWAGLSRTIPILLFLPKAIVSQNPEYKVLGERYHLAYKMVRTESRLIRNVLAAHNFCEVHQNSSEFNLLWTGSHPKVFSLRSLAEFQKVNHFPRWDLYIRRMLRLPRVLSTPSTAHPPGSAFHQPSHLLASPSTAFLVCSPASTLDRCTH
uniref:Uncharacterized protein n=1 Tax=Eptatretus burgeri TaxID=7764 RepID=A0A8C4RAB3_EPTBU